MLPLLLSSALAAPCAEADAPPLDRDVAPDGSTWLLVAGEGQVCWWAVDDNGDGTVLARWGAAAARRPVAIEALADGRALLVMAGPSDWRLAVRSTTGVRTDLGIDLPAPPDRLLGHPDLPLVAVRMHRDARTDVVWVVDVLRGEVCASTHVPVNEEALSFHQGDRRLFVAGSGARVSDARR